MKNEKAKIESHSKIFTLLALSDISSDRISVFQMWPNEIILLSACNFMGQWEMLKKKKKKLMPQTLQHEKGPLDCGRRHFAPWRHKSGSLSVALSHFTFTVLHFLIKWWLWIIYEYILLLCQFQILPWQKKTKNWKPPLLVFPFHS